MALSLDQPLALRGFTASEYLCGHGGWLLAALC